MRRLSGRPKKGGKLMGSGKRKDRFEIPDLQMKIIKTSSWSPLKLVRLPIPLIMWRVLFLDNLLWGRESDSTKRASSKWTQDLPGATAKTAIGNDCSENVFEVTWWSQVDSLTSLPSVIWCVFCYGNSTMDSFKVNSRFIEGSSDNGDK